jgi:hypothetical protein
MGDVSTFQLADGQATPVNHTFYPESVTSDLITYKTRDSEIYAGQTSVTLGRRLPSSQNSNFKTSIRLRVPVTAEVDGQVVVTHSLTANIDLICPEAATAEEKADIVAYAQNLLSQATVTDVVTANDFPY